MNKKLLYLATLLMMVLGFSACDDDKAVPPVFYPEQIGDGTGLSPYSVGTALTKIYTGDYNTKQVFVKGIVSQVSEFNASYGNITYYISDTGKEENELEVYRGLGLNGDKFTAIGDLQVGDKVIIACTLTYYNNQYPETGQGAIIVSLNGSPWTPDPVIEPAGTGVKGDAYNVTKALEVILGDNCPTEKIYVSGVVSKIDNIDTSFGNAVYYISDTGSTYTQLEIYRGYYLGGAKFTSADQLKVGDKVTVYGTVENFNGTPEFKSGSMITVLNGEENDPNGEGPKTEPKGTGTKDDPYNAAMALKVANELAADASTDKVYVEGTVSSIKEISTSFGNGTYAISDDGTTAGEFSIFRSYYLGGEKFTSADQLKVGDKVVVYGALTNYKGNTPQMAQGGEIVTLNGEGGGDKPDQPDQPDTSVVTSLNETFESGAIPAGWSNVKISGDKAWYVTSFDNNYYAAMTGYKGTQPPFDQWLVSPAVDMSKVTDKKLTFDSQVNGYGSKTSVLEVYVLSSADVANATQTKLNCTLATAPASGYSGFVPSGNVDLSSFTGTIHVAFRFYATQDANYATWCIDNVKLNSTEASSAQ